MTTDALWILETSNRRFLADKFHNKNHTGTCKWFNTFACMCLKFRSSIATLTASFLLAWLSCHVICVYYSLYTITGWKYTHNIISDLAQNWQLAILKLELNKWQPNLLIGFSIKLCWISILFLCHLTANPSVEFCNCSPAPDLLSWWNLFFVSETSGLSSAHSNRCFFPQLFQFKFYLTMSIE